ncbi:MAG TPA: hypothetical protein VM532_07320 [Burkholderiales bacterium]|nr:hypothetical protein [Burkholderiales bacterium]
MKSSLGQAFVAQVNIFATKAEGVDELCFRLATNQSGNHARTLPPARLTFSPSATGGTLHIRTNEPIREPSVQVIVEASCPGMGRVQREYVVLLDPASLALPLAVATSIESPGHTKAERVASAKPQKRKKVEAPASSVAPVQKSTYKSSPKPSPQARSKSSPPQPRVQQQTSGGFRLKLSAPIIDLSQIEKLSDEKRKELRDQQVLMDSDDQLASLLATRHKLRELEDRLASLQLRMSTITAPGAGLDTPRPSDVSPPTPPVTQPEASSSSAAPSTTTPSDAPVGPAPSVPELTAPTPDKTSGKPEQIAGQPAIERSALSQAILSGRRWLIFILILAVLTFIAIRLFRRPAKQPASTSARRYELNEAGSKTSNKTPKPAPISRAQDYSPISSSPVESSAPPMPSPANPMEAYRLVVINKFPELKSAGNTEARTIIGVAWQYFEDKGERDRAIELIEFGLKEHPDVDELWLTQFEFLLRDRRVSTYEELAKRYRERFPTDHTWIKIQSWIQIQSGGRYLDPNNALYTVEAIADNQSKVLSLDFDPTGKQEGIGKKQVEPGN